MDNKAKKLEELKKKALSMTPNRDMTDWNHLSSSDKDWLKNG